MKDRQCNDQMKDRQYNDQIKDRQYNDHMKKDKGTNNDVQNITQKTYDRATRPTVALKTRRQICDLCLLNVRLLLRFLTYSTS
jgi:hypothetical protein